METVDPNHRSPGRPPTHPLTKGCNPGAVRRAIRNFSNGGVARDPAWFYRALRRGDVVLGPDGEFRQVPFKPTVEPSVAPVTPTAEPSVAFDLSQQRALLRYLARQYVASALASGMTARDAGLGVLADLKSLIDDVLWGAP